MPSPALHTSVHWRSSLSSSKPEQAHCHPLPPFHLCPPVFCCLPASLLPRMQGPKKPPLAFLLFPVKQDGFYHFSGLDTWRQSTVPYTFKGVYRIVAIKKILCHNSVHTAVVSRNDQRKLLHLQHELLSQADRGKSLSQHPYDWRTALFANWDYQGGHVFYGHIN